MTHYLCAMKVHGASIFRGDSKCNVFANKLNFRCNTRQLKYLAIPTTTKGDGHRVGFVGSFGAATLRTVPDCTVHLTRIFRRRKLSPGKAALGALIVNTRPRASRRHHGVRQVLNIGTCGDFNVARVGNPNITFRYRRRGKVRF